MNRLVVGFFGLKNAGKDAAARALIKSGWSDAQIFKFATPLKEMSGSLLGVSPDMLNGEDEGSRRFRESENEALIALTGGKIKTPRHLLQWIGTDAFRALHKDIWVNHLEYRIRKSKASQVIVTDCRFDNEMGLIKKLGGVCVKVVRAGQVNEDSHASEAMPFDDGDFDLILNNDGDLEQFHTKVQNSFMTLFANQSKPEYIDPRL